MAPALKLAHYVTMNRKELWVQYEVREMAQDALTERDTLMMRIAKLEQELKREKRAQLYGMTDLA